MDSATEPYDDAPFDLLNPTRIRYYFILDSPPIDIGEYLVGDKIQMHITPYMAISETAFVRWFLEPSELSESGENITILTEGAEGILINGIRDEEFGHIRAVVYDFTKEIPGKVAVGQRLFDIRKDITKTCSGNIRSTHTCQCNDGFEGNGVHCLDVDECTEGTPYNCLPGATCVNTPGSYKCQCENGYEGDGIYSCIDIDECLLQRHSCSPSAFCVNTLGSFTCLCQAGHFGDGIHCIASSTWTPWSPWSTCTATCGVQNKMRIRECTHPESGMRCEGPSAELMGCEMLRPCPVNGQWSEWSPWSPCTASCAGIKKRVRICDNPSLASGAVPCSGPSEQVMPCGNTDCQVTGSWSTWTAWSPCPLSCGMAIMKRSRTCNAPVSRESATYCAGHSQQERSCGFPVDYCKYLSQSSDSVLTGKWT
ncbi:adhesion G protein-coupled receptor B1-like [Hypanus sabinus]|uniref:adhesion G protein-coupled receptor B1-like n=1 Tax=Hypanus sabinus TaxID=79690 RepID=UPI0028C43CCC|nr:adhesion G protein-coupled receptor B1-like [Hypanus sabinus]